MMIPERVGADRDHRDDQRHRHWRHGAIRHGVGEGKLRLGRPRHALGAEAPEDLVRVETHRIGIGADEAGGISGRGQGGEIAGLDRLEEWQANLQPRRQRRQCPAQLFAHHAQLGPDTRRPGMGQRSVEAAIGSGLRGRYRAIAIHLISSRGAKLDPGKRLRLSGTTALRRGASGRTRAVSFPENVSRLIIRRKSCQINNDTARGRYGDLSPFGRTIARPSRPSGTTTSP